MKLSLNAVTKSYGKNLALNGFSADFEPGIYALLGPNGSGKSTLMNIITGNLKCDSGEIKLDGHDVAKMGAEYLCRLGYMPQYPGTYPDFTAEEFLRYTAQLKGSFDNLRGKERKEHINSEIAGLLINVGLDDVGKMKTSTFSGGMKQRLALVAALVASPSIIILDEPTAGLDPKQRIEIRNLISRVAFDKIVIIATHVVADIEFISQRVIMLKKGIINDNATPAELVKKISGKVWTFNVTENEVPDVQRAFRVVNISRDEKDEGMVSLRVLSDTAPSEKAIEASPTIEDYYLYIYER